MTHEHMPVAVLPRPLPPGLDTRPGRVGVVTVAWRHVLGTAAVLSLANCYWAVLLRDLSGSATRGDASLLWLRESAVLLPCYVVAVLGAAALVHRRRGHAAPLAAPSALATCVAVTVSAALVGVVSVAGIATSSATSTLQTPPLPRVVLAVVITDAVVVALLAALDGGRLAVLGPDPATDAAGDGEGGRGPRSVEQAGRALAATLLGSAVVHAAVLPAHLGHWALQGEFFWLLVMAQSVAGVLVLRMQRTGLLVGVAALSLGTVGVWAVSRTTGLPFGPEAWQREPVGVADLAATTLALASLGLAVLLLRGRTWLRRPAPPHLQALGLASVVAATVLGVAGTSLPLVGAFPPATPAHAEGHTPPGP